MFMKLALFLSAINLVAHFMRYWNNSFVTVYSNVYITFVFQQYPDYYAIIKEPIDLKTIAQRIQVQYEYML